MATRSNIAVKLSDGKIKNIYCHWDGYIKGVGKNLMNHHDTQELAELLVSFGDMSSLRELSEPLTENHSFDNPENNVSIYYGRDRNETDIEPRIYDNFDMYEQTIRSSEKNDIEYFYYYDGDTWNVKANSSNYYNVGLTNSSRWFEVNQNLIDAQE